MQTIDNIKKGLACHAQDRSYMLPCSGCDYHGQGKPHCRKAVHEDALALIEQMEARVPKWISVEKPPARPGFYLVMIQGAKQATMLWWSICGEWYDNPAITYRVTHWMPLPEPPTEDGKTEPDHRPEDCVNYATRQRDGRAVCLGTRDLEPCEGALCKRWKAKKNGGTEDED